MKSLYIFKSLFFLFFIFIQFSKVFSQVTYNGKFEQLDYSGLPRGWFTPAGSDLQRFNLKTDSTNQFEGRYALSVRSKENVSRNNSIIIFREIPIKPGLMHTLKVNYHFKITDTSNFHYFINAFADIKPSKRTKPKINWTTDSKKSEWLKLEVKLDILDSNCNNIMFGFVVGGKTDIMVDAVSLYLDDALIVDKPYSPLIFPEKEAVAYIKENYVALNSRNDYKDLGDLSFFRNVVGNSTVIALGEGSHGTKEFFTLHNRLILYLVDSMGFSSIDFENDFIATQWADEMLHDTLFSSKKILDSAFGRMHQTDEMVALFDLLRSRIKDKKKIHIRGFDNQSFYLPLVTLTKLLKDTPDTFLYHEINAIEKYRMAYRYSAGKYDTLNHLASQLSIYFSKRKVRLYDEISKMKVDTMEKYLALLKNAFQYEYIKAIQYVERDRDRNNSIIFRDSLMADNVLYFRQKYPSEKNIVIAHNAHVEKKYSETSGRPYAMGAFLDKNLANNYQAFSFFTASGTATAYSQYGKPHIIQLLEPDGGDYEYYLQKGVTAPMYYLNLKNLNKPKVFLTSLKGRLIGYESLGGNQFLPLRLQYNNDGIFFIKNTTNASSFYFP